jgi:hypothetical protein
MIRLCSVLTAGLLLWTSSLRAGGEEEAIERVLLEETKSSATFAETRDKQAVLKLYTEQSRISTRTSRARRRGPRMITSSRRLRTASSMRKTGANAPASCTKEPPDGLSDINIARRRNRKAWSGKVTPQRCRSRPTILHSSSCSQFHTVFSPHRKAPICNSLRRAVPGYEPA